MILKILDSRKGGEVSTDDIARELAVLDGTMREISPSNLIENGIFGSGFVDVPTRGLWRITDKGRAYLRSVNQQSAQTEQLIHRREATTLNIGSPEDPDIVGGF